MVRPGPAEELTALSQAPQWMYREESNWEYKKLSYCWETVRRDSMPRIAEMDVKMTT